MDRVFTEDEVRARLEMLPRWSYVRGEDTPDGAYEGAIERTFRTASFKATLMLVTTIGHLCEAAWHHPQMVVGYDTLVVKLSTHKPKGITDRDFALAARIEEVVSWRPEPGGPLTGPPDDPRYAYLRDV